MAAPFKFQVTVQGMDLDAWGRDYGLGDPQEIADDFRQFAVGQIVDSLDGQLRRMGHHNQTVEVQPTN